MARRYRRRGTFPPVPDGWYPVHLRRIGAGCVLPPAGRPRPLPRRRRGCAGHDSGGQCAGRCCAARRGRSPAVDICDSCEHLLHYNILTIITSNLPLVTPFREKEENIAAPLLCRIGKPPPVLRRRWGAMGGRQSVRKRSAPVSAPASVSAAISSSTQASASLPSSSGSRSGALLRPMTAGRATDAALSMTGYW